MENVRKRLIQFATKERAKVLQHFFKTGKGEYGEGDVFLGVNVPDSRKVAKEFVDINLDDVRKLLQSKVHEERLVGLLILVEKYNNGDRKRIYNFYMDNMKFVNNWDLVDLTADKIVGEHLLDKPKGVLYKLAKSSNLWERRISIIATFQFIKNNQFEDALKISEMLLKDDHDLIQKAVGWMLREIGKRNIKIEDEFLKIHYKEMPRTMLRYAVERHEESKRMLYLKK